MADAEQLRLLSVGAEGWSRWRSENPARSIDLRGAHLSRAHLDGYDLAGADLYRANLWKATMRGANLSGADLSSANLNRTDLEGANLAGSNLRFCRMVGANVTNATLSGSFVYGCAAWTLRGVPREQTDLVVTPRDEAPIAVDDIELAQFLYLLLNTQKLRSLIDSVSSKAVLILGRFTAERMIALQAIRTELRRRGYLPMLFDFARPVSRDLSETVSTLAHIACFVIADLSDARSVPQELAALIPTLPSVPVQPIICVSEEPYDLFEHFARYPWVLPIHRYASVPDLVAAMADSVIAPAIAKANLLRARDR